MDVKTIVLEYLKREGYDGLCKEECGCTIDDYMPCGGEYIDECEPAYKVDLPEELKKEMGCDIALFRTKEECEQVTRYYKELVGEIEEERRQRLGESTQT